VKEATDKLAGGFTLVEMLVAVFVIAILVTVMVGVSGIVVRRSGVAHTRATMKVVGRALDAYRDVAGRDPVEPASARSVPPPGWRGRDWQAYMRGKSLYASLMGVPRAQRILQSLPRDAFKSPRGGNRTFADGFGKYMDYLRSKGLKGAPLLLSAGLDGDFDRQEDNIRSDDL
jgi:prepilin-type N-terminal cleavage/methylation domain-containing protein